MQDSQADKEKMKWSDNPKVNRIGLCVATFLLILVASLVIFNYRHIPTMSGRFYCDKLPWNGTSVVVDSIECHWRSSQGNARLMLRSDFYPVAKVSLKEATGDGRMYFYLYNPDDKKIGDTVYLEYGAGGFKPNKNSFIQIIDAKNALIHFDSFSATEGLRDNSFYIHCVSPTERLWSVSVATGDAKGGNIQTIGNCCIHAELGE